MVARAKTGSGKTLAYLLPMFHALLKLCSEKHATKASPNVFVLVPTRELCQQVSSLRLWFVVKTPMDFVIAETLILKWMTL